MSFIAYDIAFLAVFAVFALFFLHRKRANLKRHGWMFLYHTKWGIPLMDSLATKHRRWLRPLQYIVVGVGYALLICMTWLLFATVYDYVSSPFLAKALKIPPLLPLFPYFPQIFKIESLFPPFYFTYFIIAIAIVAIGHEFAHGLFARLNKVRIKSTGFAFFGPFFGAFVEQDDKDMNKLKKFPQLAILAAGVFVNLLLSIIFGLAIWGFFSASFVPAGVQFNTYTTAIVNVSDISEVNGLAIANISQIPLLVNESLATIRAGNATFFVPGASLATVVERAIPSFIAYDDAPAINAQLKGAIRSVEGIPTPTLASLRTALNRYRPGENVTIVSVIDGEAVSYTLALGEREGKAYLGVGVGRPEQKGIRGWIGKMITSVKDPFTYYEPRWGGDFAWFVYYLLWWIFMINLLVALFNMLPLGILDGGRFFYLTIWGLTGREPWGKKAFAIASWLFIALFALMMVKWVFALF